MAVALYFDVHIDHAVASQLRLRQIDILTAQEDGTTRLPDDQLLERAALLGRPLVTQDIRFHALAETWQSQGRPFCGLVFGHPKRVTLGQFVKDLELIAMATAPDDWVSAVVRLPL